MCVHVETVEVSCARRAIPAAPTAPEVQIDVPRHREGAGNAGRSNRPQPRVRKWKSTRASHHRFAVTIRHSLRDGVTASFALSPEIGLVVSVCRVMRRIIATLTSPSRCQDHTTSPSTVSPLVGWRHCGHRIPRPTSVTIAIRPSYRARDGRASKGDLPDGASGMCGGVVDLGQHAPIGAAAIKASSAP